MLYLLAVVWCIFHISSNYFLENIANKWYSKNSKGIFDIFHICLPDLRENILDIKETLTKLYLIPLLFYGNRTVYNFLKTYLKVMIIRTVFLIQTVLPKYHKCIPKHGFSLKNILLYFTGETCYDKIFSGHFAIIYIASRIYHLYKIPILGNIWFINIANALLILLTRDHYTVDISVSWCISWYWANKMCKRLRG